MDRAKPASVKVAETFARSELCQSILQLIGISNAQHLISHQLEQVLPVVLDCGLDWLYNLYHQVVLNCSFCDLSLQEVWKVLAEVDAQNDFLLRAASILYPTESQSRHRDLHLPLLWLMDFLCGNSEPLMWRLSSKDGEYQAICGSDGPQQFQGDMKIGIPVALADTRYSFVDRVWIMQPCQRGMVVREKFMGLGFGDIDGEEVSSPYFRDMKQVAIVGPVEETKNAASGDDAMIESATNKMRELGLSGDKEKDASESDSNDESPLHVTGLEMNFIWDEDDE